MRAVVTCAALALAACQAVTDLDTLDIRVSDAAVHPADAGLDATPPSAAGPTAMPPDAGPAEDHCLIADGAECDPVRQCGCDAGKHCQVRTSSRRPTCVAPGSIEPWSGCRDSRECPTGQTCDRGSCRPYCETDADCAGGRCFVAESSDDSSSDDVQVCWKRCEPGMADACAKGTACRSTKTPTGETGTFCVAPFDPCPTAEDGRCDDSKGTGMCADGSDKKDCDCAPTLPGAPCDPVSQCGCARDRTCEIQSVDTNRTDDNVITLTAACEPRGTKTLYEECADARECGPGLTCDLNIRMCVNYCRSSSDCVGGACERLLNRDDPNIGVCTPRCSRSTGAPCLPGVACATFSSQWQVTLFSEPGDYCWLPVISECPTNGVCDEPQGTAICAAGTDSADCCVKSNGGECNHVTGCGCESQPGTQCRQLLGITLCDVQGTAAPWSICSGLGENCSPGYSCGERVCRKNCATDQDCGQGNECVAFLDFSGNEAPGIGGCFMACDFEQEGSCPDGLACALTSPPRAFCLLPYDECPSIYIGNGRCDDQRPGGTRTCAMGTDPDCTSSNG